MARAHAGAAQPSCPRERTTPGARWATRGATCRRRALKLAGFLLVVYVVLKLIPALEQALHALEHASWEWVLGLLAIEVLSEAGFVFAWSAIVDPQNVLARDGRGRRMDQHVAWAQLGGGLLLPGGSWGGMGVGGVILHRFGMPTKLIAERQFNLSFLNTGHRRARACRVRRRARHRHLRWRAATSC